MGALKDFRGCFARVLEFTIAVREQDTYSLGGPILHRLGFRVESGGRGFADADEGPSFGCVRKQANAHATLSH